MKWYRVTRGHFRLLTKPEANPSVAKAILILRDLWHG
jgi:hypothetical protein